MATATMTAVVVEATTVAGGTTTVATAIVALVMMTGLTVVSAMTTARAESTVTPLVRIAMALVRIVVAVVEVEVEVEVTMSGHRLQQLVRVVTGTLLLLARMPRTAGAGRTRTVV